MSGLIATVMLQYRDDGGLRVWSEQFPGLVLSHARADLVMTDILPALAEMGFSTPAQTASGVEG